MSIKNGKLFLIKMDNMKISKNTNFYKDRIKFINKFCIVNHIDDLKDKWNFEVLGTLPYFQIYPIFGWSIYGSTIEEVISQIQESKIKLIELIRKEAVDLAEYEKGISYLKEKSKGRDAP